MAEVKAPKVSKAKLYKMISFKGSIGSTGSQFTPLTAAKSMGEVQAGVKALVAGVNSMGATLNSVALTTEKLAEAMAASVQAQIKGANKVFKAEDAIRKDEEKRRRKEEADKKKADAKARREKSEEESEKGSPGLFGKIKNTFKEQTKKAFGGIFGTLAKIAGFFLKYFIVFGILNWMQKNPDKVEKLAKGLAKLGKFIYKVTSFLVGSAFDGLIKFLDNPISLNGLFGGIQFLLSAAPLFVGMAFLKNPVATVKALTWVIGSLGKGIMNLSKAGKLFGTMKKLATSRFAKIAGVVGGGAVAAISAAASGADTAEVIGAGIGGGAGTAIGGAIGSAVGGPLGGMIGGAVGQMAGSAVGQGLGKLMGPIFEPIGKFFKMIGDVFNGVMAPIKDALGQFFEALGGFMNGILDMVEPHLPFITEVLAKSLKIYFMPFFMGLKALTAVLKFFTPKGKGSNATSAKNTSKGKAAGGKVPVMVPKMAEGGDTLGSPLMSREEKFWDEMTEVLMGQKGIITAVKTIAEGIISFLANPIGTTASAVMTVGGNLLSSAWNWGKNLLGFAHGGNVPSNTVQPMAMPAPAPQAAAKGGWISGPQSGYPVSLDGGRSVSFIGHGTEWVGMKNYAKGGAFVVPFDTPATKSNPGLTQRRMNEAKAGGYAMPRAVGGNVPLHVPKFKAGGAMKPTLPKFAAGGKFDPVKYAEGGTNTEGLVLNDKTYYVKYTHDDKGAVVVKNVSKRFKTWGVGLPGFSGETLIGVQPGTPEFKAIIDSKGFRDSVTKRHTKTTNEGLRDYRVKIPYKITSITTHPQANIAYVYNKSYQETYEAWKKKGLTDEAARQHAASAASQLALATKNSAGQGQMSLPGAVDPQTGEKIEGAAPAEMANVDVVTAADRAAETAPKTETAEESLTKLLTQFGKVMSDTIKDEGDYTGFKLGQAAQRESEATSKIFEKAATMSDAQIKQAFEMPPIVTGGIGGASTKDIVVDGKKYYEADPYLMPKFGIVADFNNDMVDLM